MTSDTIEGRVAQRSPSVGAMLVRRVELTPKREAFRYLEDGRWVSIDWEQTRDRIFELAAGLLALGLHRGDRAAIASGTRIEWILADLAIMTAGCATTTVYPTTQHHDVAFILADSESKVIFAEDAGQAQKVLEHRAELPSLVKIVQIDGQTDDELVMGWDEFVQLGKGYLGEQPTCVDDAIAELGPDDLATLIYTSGTTGQPKGVRLAQDNWTYLGRGVEEYDIIDESDVQYLWLPLSHVFGKALIAIQVQIGFSTAVDGSIENIVENLGQVHPTFMAGAPRIFEKVRAKVMMSANSGVKAKIFSWAFGVGRKTIPTRLAGDKPSGLIGAQYAVADKLVFSKIKARMGGNIKFFVSGSAALNREVQEWFYAADLLILEGYGLTETSAASAVNNPRAARFGTVGPPLPGMQVKIDDDGEILLHGPGVMHGYHNRAEATAEAIVDGWFHTGDIGELDPAGYIKITDRKKDLIKTSGGKYVAPQKVEGAIKAACPYISQVVVHGDGRKFVSALFTLDPEEIVTWGEANGLGGKSAAELSKTPQVEALISGYVDQANVQLERWETIKKFAILPAELSVEAGEMTPSMKVRRKAVEVKYVDLLDGLYPKD